MSLSSDFSLSILKNKFVLTRPLGNGGFGEVYEAFDPRLGTQYAVKIVHCETEEKRRQVTHEAQLLARHSKKLRFLPDVYDEWFDGQKYFLVMEFIEGDTLQAHLDHAGPPWAAARVESFLRMMLQHLVQLHDAGIVHRDLKPSNIKAHPQRGYILLDFGIAKQFDTFAFAKDVGTVEYAPLEQMTQGGSTDQRSDLYSLGATAYQLLTRQLPVQPHLRNAARHSNQGETLIPPSRLVGGVPPALERTLLALLALDLEGRPANARAALAMLDTPPGDSVIAPPAPKRLAPAPSAPAAAKTVSLPGGMPTVPLAPGVVAAAARPVAAIAAAPGIPLVQRFAHWRRSLWQPIPTTSLIFTGLWASTGAIVGAGAGWAIMLDTIEGGRLLYPVLGALVGAFICAVARLLALPQGHRDELSAAIAAGYVAALAIFGALVGGLYKMVDVALRGQDVTVMLGAAFGPLLGSAAVLLLQALRERSLDALRRIGTGAVFVTFSAGLLGIVIGSVVGCLFWLIPPGSGTNLLSDCIVPGALGGGLFGAAIGLYLGTATLLLRES